MASSRSASSGDAGRSRGTLFSVPGFSDRFSSMPTAPFVELRRSPPSNESDNR